jgi:hypothetical protein
MSDIAYVLPLGALILLLWFWVDTLRAREQALQVGRQACREIGAQLLDHTVALRRLRVVRNAEHRGVWRRTYRFEYSLDGLARLQGSVILRGRRLETVALRNSDGSTQYEAGSGYE